MTTGLLPMETGQVVVLLCDDAPKTGPGRVAAAEIAAGVRSRAPGLRVAVVPNLCSGAVGLAAALRALGARRVVAGCRHAASRHDEITGRLLRAGFHRAGIAIADLRPGGRADKLRVAAQSAARIHAAVARISNADLDAPYGMGLAAFARPLPRRALFHPGTFTSGPVVHCAPDRCPGSEGCRVCASACPHGAISCSGFGVTVDPAACTGCGACLTACPAGAMSLSSLPIQAFEAAANVLVTEARRPGPGRVHGVAIVCERAAAQVPVGAEWLPLEVPSLEMASVGWPLQMLSAGVGVAIVGCDDDACARHGHELDESCAALADQTASGWRRVSGPLPGWEPAETPPAGFDMTGRAVRVSLREPAATAAALSALASRAQPVIRTPEPPVMQGSLPADTGQEKQWRFEAPAASLGEITVDPARCSACGNCARACPTGALTATYPDGLALALAVDVSRCSACGVCVSSCPEGAVSMRRVLDSASLAAGRQTVAEITTGGRCQSCGRPLAGGLASGIIGERLAASHPAIAARLRDERRCTDCLLDASRSEHADPP